MLSVPLLLCLLAAGLCGVAQAETEARRVFEQASPGVYQVLIVDASSGEKSAIGSGFRVAYGHYIATNFHVVSDAVHKPEKYRIETIDNTGARAPVALVDFDVVHDLAVLRAEGEAVSGLALAGDELGKGEAIYSLGNPYDLGQTVVPGTYNGLLERSFYQKLLFSGSLNPGMSGGPALNGDGHIVGVNVATSGNQISFLVPVKYLQALLERVAGREVALPASDYQAEIGRQLQADQEYKYALLLNLDWPAKKLGDMQVAGEVSAYFKCWGDTSDEEDNLYDVSESACTSEDTIFLSSSLQTGAVDYQYSWTTSDDLGALRFHRLLTDSNGRMYTRNPAGEDDVTNYQCDVAFIGAATSPRLVWRTVQCVRAYKRYSGLYDVLFLGVMLGRDQRSLTGHFALSGVSQANARAFTSKFMALSSWDS
ncbi:MAG: serine protease [Pseudomonadales bacterium]